MFPTFQGAFLFLSAGAMLYLLMDLLSTRQCVGLCKSIFQRCLCECTCISPQSAETPGISAQVESDEGQIEIKLSLPACSGHSLYHFSVRSVLGISE